MDVFERRRDRLAELVREVPASELAVRTGIAESTISRYLMAPDNKNARRLGEKNARRLEHAGRKPLHWLDQAPHASGPHLGGQAQPVSHIIREAAPPYLQWEQLMKGPLEAEFQTQMPDASMAPEIPRGAQIIFVTGVAPEPGDFVLVADADDRTYVREYRELKPGHWQAHAINPAFLPLDSAEHALRVLAVFDGIRGRRARR